MPIKIQNYLRKVTEDYKLNKTQKKTYPLLLLTHSIQIAVVQAPTKTMHPSATTLISIVLSSLPLLAWTMVVSPTSRTLNPAILCLNSMFLFSIDLK